MLNVYVDLTSGVSWQGNSDRAWMAWHWENMYGCFLLLVCAGVSHCSAVQSLVVWTSILSVRRSPECLSSIDMVNGLPYGSILEAETSNWASLPLTLTPVTSR